MKHLSYLYLLVVTILILPVSCVNLTIPIISAETQNDPVSGVLNHDSSVAAFKGIPFAAPPVGELRWKAPQPVENWSEVRICDEFPPSAMQADPVPFLMWTQEFIAPAEPLSEDCLYLNIWTAAHSSQEKRPVLVFIHGGGFSSGSGSVPIYDGEEMARKGVVFITINYRVGIFGFFSHPQLTAESPSQSSDNQGLLDQVAALEWIQENISVFGGDPGNVTIAGQSAGAFSVNYLVASPLASGLFQRAIAESGGAILSTGRLSGMTELEEAEQAGLELADQVRVSSLSELRDLPPDSLLKIRSMAGPIIDGYALPENLFSIFSSGKQNDVPLMMGWNAQEGNFGGPPLGAEAFKESAEAQYGDRVEEFLMLFPADNDSVAIKSQMDLGGLQTFGVQSFTWMKLQNETGISDVYMYHFTRALPFGEGQRDWGAFHTGEVPYAYKNLRMSEVRPWEDTDYHMEEVMSSYWVNFASNGDPNGENLPDWQPCKPDKFNTMYLGDEQESFEIPHLSRLKFLEDIYTSRMDSE